MYYVITPDDELYSIHETLGQATSKIKELIETTPYFDTSNACDFRIIIGEMLKLDIQVVTETHVTVRTHL